MVLLMKVTDSLDDDEPIYYDLDDPKQNDQFKKYCQGLSRIGYVRDTYPGDRVTIECIRRDD
jgi:hypothetical protein